MTGYTELIWWISLLPPGPKQGRSTFPQEKRKRGQKSLLTWQQIENSGHCHAVQKTEAVMPLAGCCISVIPGIAAFPPAPFAALLVFWDDWYAWLHPEGTSLCCGSWKVFLFLAKPPFSWRLTQSGRYRWCVIHHVHTKNAPVLLPPLSPLIWQ